MTTALCLNCGELKFGAFLPCSKCGHEPVDPEDRAKHLLVSDHYISPEDLEEIGSRIRAGEELRFDPEALQETATKVSAITEAMGDSKGCGLTGILVVVVILLGLAFLVRWACA